MGAKDISGEINALRKQNGKTKGKNITKKAV